VKLRCNELTHPSSTPLVGASHSVLHALVDCQLQPGGPLAAAATPTGGAWREPHLAVLQALLDARAECVAPQLPSLVTALAAACSGALKSSPKLAQAMMALAAGFGPGLGCEGVAALVAGAERTSSFLTKRLLAKLRQLAHA